MTRSSSVVRRASAAAASGPGREPVHAAVGLADQLLHALVRGSRTRIDRTRHRVRLVEEPYPGIGEQRTDDVLAYQDHRCVAGVAVPALPGRGVEHGGERAGGRARVRGDRCQLGAADLHHVTVVDTDLGLGVALPGGRSRDPDLVVRLRVGIAAGELVALTVVDEGVLDRRDAQDLRGLARVRGVDQHLERRVLEAHQLGDPGDAHDGDVRRADLLHHEALAQHDERAAVGPGQRVEPHIGLVRGRGAAREVHADGRLVLGEPGVEPVEHLFLRGGTATRKPPQQHGQSGAGEKDRKPDAGRGELRLVARRRHQQARGRGQTEQQQPRTGPAHQQRGGAGVIRRAEASMLRVSRGMVRLARTSIAVA